MWVRRDRNVPIKTMKLSRRNVLAGIGGLAVGGGALLGSGAFSSVEAQRTVDVNVVTGPDIATESVDVILNNVGAQTSVSSPANPELGVDTASDGPDDPDALFPDNSNTSDFSTNYTPEDNDVSLIDNDVKIIFGVSGQSLPPNSQVDYDGLFSVVNESSSPSQAFNVTLETDSDTTLLTDQTDTTPIDSGTVSNDSSTDLDARLNTGGSNQTDTLIITITEV